MTTKRIMVTGPRTWKGARYYEALEDKINLVTHYWADAYHLVLVEGEAEGFDKMARIIAEAHGWEIDPYPIESWYVDGNYNPEAGHARNQLMVDSGIDLALAGMMLCEKDKCKGKEPHLTHGTQDGLKRLQAAKITTILVNPDDI